MHITTIGLDLSKHWFQIHGVDAAGKVVVKRLAQQNDAADAGAICAAVTRPSMRFVPVKDVDQQSVLMMHRARNLLVRQRTMLVNALRAHLAEFGVIAPWGLRHVERLVAAIEENNPALTINPEGWGRSKPLSVGAGRRRGGPLRGPVRGGADGARP